ncbi:flavanone 3-dioxygenase 2-like [Humulus lupulus]|uniref:flavanone 3-dioxygenase 2-like n=1 Tax=Humulus lupulus TaxID=3486 RepID=UPI002B411309|nr:flavanone 3-dioxygenase 2-like [Humulus lupulus]
MEKLLSTKRDMKFVPEAYIMPPDTRPGNTKVPICENIPVIDLKADPTKLSHQILDACKEFGFFQLINHGVPEKMLRDVLEVTKEYFKLPAEDKAIMFSDDINQSSRLHTSMDYTKEQLHYWRDALKHPCHPLEKHIQSWPQKPPQYREVMGPYSVEVRNLSLCLLDLISKGLGLEPGYFSQESEQFEVRMSVNHYPPCPDPSLTLGLPKHADVVLLTLLLQQMNGLQILKDGQWLAVEPLPNAFVVNIGHTLEIISNGKLRSVEHRVVTNQKLGRTTISSFILPCQGYQVEPGKGLIKDDSPPLYKSFIFKDFLATYITDTCQRKSPLDRYKLI